MKNQNFYRYIPIVIIFAFIFVSVYQVINICSGEYIYPVENAYLQLSTAGNFAQNGVWGLSKYAFSSSVTSILFTLILSITIFIFGNNPTFPLLLNIIFSYFILNLIFNILKPYIFIDYGNGKQRIISGLILSGIVTLIALLFPIVFLSLSGMEYILQILVFLLFIRHLIAFFDDDNSRNFVKLLILSFFVTLASYEGIFLILISMLFFVNRYYYRKGLLILVSSILPLAIYGAISYSKGWNILPNILILQSNLPDSKGILSILLLPINWIIHLIYEPHLLSIFVASLGILWENLKARMPIREGKNLFLIITIGLTILHLTFLDISRIYHNEAYIVAIGLVGLIINLSEIIKFANNQLKRIAVILVLVVIFTCGKQSYKSIKNINVMATNIYEQTIQVAKFLKKYYNNSTVAMSSVGASTYLTDINIIDLSQINTNIDLNLFSKNYFDANKLERIAKENDAEIAIIRKEIHSDLIPSDWIEVESWKIPNNISLESDEITFYSIKPDKAIYLIFNLSQYRTELPAEIKVTTP